MFTVSVQCTLRYGGAHKQQILENEHLIAACVAPSYNHTLARIGEDNRLWAQSAPNSPPTSADLRMHAAGMPVGPTLAHCVQPCSNLVPLCVPISVLWAPHCRLCGTFCHFTPKIRIGYDRLLPN